MVFNFVVAIILICIMFALTAIAFKFRTKERLVVILMFFSFSILFFLIYDLVVHATLFALFIVVYIGIIIIIGKRNYEDVKIRQLNFSSEKVKEDIEVLFVADFQFDRIAGVYNEKAFINAINKINQIDYDILLLGGDYINYQESFEIFLNGLKQIKNKDHIYAVMGNHDFFIKDKLRQAFESINIKVLENELEHVQINQTTIDISGLKDMWYDEPNYEVVKNKVDTNNYHISLLHNPDYIKNIKDEKINLVLSGHYHKGQVNLIPKVTAARLVTKYTYGLFDVNKIKLFVTSGIGGSFLRGKLSLYVRWNANPELVKIKIASK